MGLERRPNEKVGGVL